MATSTYYSKFVRRDSMAVGFRVKFYWYQVGTSDFLHCFFSTVCVCLERKKHGSKYPCIMKKLYHGKLDYTDIGSAIKELQEIKSELKKYTPENVVWDIDDLSANPPWGNNISHDITDLSVYFVTSDGEDLITKLEKALEKAQSLKTSLLIESI